MSSEECRELLTVIVTSVLPEGSRILGTCVTQLPKTDDKSKQPLFGNIPLNLNLRILRLLNYKQSIMCLF